MRGKTSHESNLNDKRYREKGFGMTINDYTSDIKWYSTSLKKISESDKKDYDISIKILEDEESFFSLATQWRALAKRTGTSIYLSFEWAKYWWIHFGRNNRRSLYIITIWNGDTLIAIAPFYTGYSSIGPYVIQKRMQLIGSGGSPNEQFGFLDDYGISDFLDVIVDTDYRKETAEILLDLLDNGFLNTDILTFHQSGDDSFVMNYLLPHLSQSKWDFDCIQTDNCPYIELTNQSSFQKYVKGLKSNARRRINQTLRAIGQEEAYVIESVDGEENVTKAIDTLIELHQSRWNKLGFPGVFYDQRFKEFFTDITQSAYRNGWLWFKEAIDEEGVCASRMIIAYNGRYFDYISGFDDARKSSKYRPGIGLLVALIEEAINSNTERIELLRGEEKYKYDFTAQHFQNWKVWTRRKQTKYSFSFLMTRLLEYTALIYKYVVREQRLLNVQRMKAGPLKMFWGYLQFRWTSLKLKFQA